MSNYVKLFSSILDSTVWDQSVEARIVWITMLAMADRHGEVSASVPGLAKRAGVSREDAEAALASFLAPDPDSRTKDNDGRRIVAIDGGWRLLNHGKYRAQMTAEDVRAKNAERQRRFREKTCGTVTPGDDASRNVTSNGEALRVTLHNGSNDIRSESEADQKQGEREPDAAAPVAPTAPVAKPKRVRAASVPGTRIPDDYAAPASVIEWAHNSLGVDPMPSVDKFVDHWKSSRQPNSIKADWDAALRNWVRTDAEAGKLPAWDPPPEPKPESHEPKIPMPANASAALFAALSQTEQEQLPDCRREVSK